MSSEAPPNRSLLALRGVFWSVINALVPTIASLLVFVLTARLLSPADFGVVAIAGALTAAASALVPAGFGDALVQRMETDPVCLDSVFWLCTTVGVALYAILTATAGDASRLFRAPALASIIPVLGLRVVFETAAVVPTALVTQALSFHLLALRTALATLVSAVISVGLVLNGFGLWALVASLLVNSCVAAIAMFWSTGWWPRLRFSAGRLVSLSGYGAYASGTRLVNFLGGQADQALVGLLLGTMQLGFYNFARRIFAILNDLTSGALNSVAHPAFSGIRTDRNRVRRGFLLATFLSSVIAFPIFVGLACVVDRAVPLVFGPQWDGALWPVRILCGLGLITCIGMLQAGLISSLGQPNWWFYYQFGASLLNVPIIVFFARYGTSVMLMVLVGKVYLLWPVPVVMTLRLLSLRARTYLLQFAGPLLATIAMSGAILLGKRILPAMPAAPALAADIGLGAVVYVVVLLVTGRRRIAEIVLLLRNKLAGPGDKLPTPPRAPALVD